MEKKLLQSHMYNRNNVNEEMSFTVHRRGLPLSLTDAVIFRTLKKKFDLLLRVFLLKKRKSQPRVEPRPFVF